jgi:hypothetical protein
MQRIQRIPRIASVCQSGMDNHPTSSSPTRHSQDARGNPPHSLHPLNRSSSPLTLLLLLLTK